MSEKDKPKVNINDLTDSKLTPEEQESVKGGIYTGGGISIGGIGGVSAASEPPVSRGRDFSTNMGTKDADEDVD